MITLLHGDHIEVSRAELNRLKQQAQGRELRSIDGRSIDPAILVQALESSSLFGGTALIVVEQLFGKLGRQPKKITQYADILARAGETSDIILWENKELTAGTVKQLGARVTVRLFKLPVLIFQFLDNIYPGNRTVLLSAFTKLMETQAPELGFSMCVQRVRQLLHIRSGNTPEGLAGWQLSRLTSQAKSFTMDELVNLYEKLGDAEYALKSGSSPFPFRMALEQIFLTL